MINEAKFECLECGKRFTKMLGKKTTEVKCPKCKSTDVEIIKDSVEYKIEAYLRESKIPDNKEDEVIDYLKHGDDPDDDFDPDELEMGIEVEKEHNDNPDVAKAIAKAHLSEIPDYYTRLKKMEKEGKKANELLDFDDTPESIFQTMPTKILMMIANKKIDPIKIAKGILADKGVGKSGNWVGFDKSKKLWGIK